MSDVVERYNYDSFTQENVSPWMNYEASPPLGQVAPSFPLQTLSGDEQSLQGLWSAARFLVVEFGSFT